MKTPRPGSAGDRICKTLHQEGPLSADAIIAKLGKLNRRTFHSAVHDLGMQGVKGIYCLTSALRNYYDGLHTDKAEGDVVTLYRPNVFSKEMTGYSLKPKCMREGTEIRDISFKTTATSFGPVSYDK